MYHGMINVYKEKGFTSHDVVAKLRGICRQKKIGHTGTLDPDAVGVLPVCLGSATRLCDMLTEKDKEYTAQFRLGVVTDTQDLSGNVLEESPVNVTLEQVREVIGSFAGESMQIPPMYSALKVNGKKLYELARAGKEVERKPRPITISSIIILKENLPDFTIRVVCSKGTYIRTLCHDIGGKLGCGAVMTHLTRSRVGSFTLEDAHPLSELQKLSEEGRLEEVLIPVEKMFEGLEILTAREEAYKSLKNGNQMRKTDFLLEENEAKSRQAQQPEGIPEEKEYRVYSHEGKFFGVYRYDEKRRLYSPVKLFFME